MKKNLQENGGGARSRRGSVYGVKTNHKTYNPREETPLEEAVGKEWDETRPFVARLPTKDEESLLFRPNLLGGTTIFCGHLMADLDSIAGAIGAAELYGGIPARASEVNAETQFALEYWNCNQPEKVEVLLQNEPHAKIWLVDFQQRSQLHEAIPMQQIMGVIDHHALQSSTIVTERPIFVDIRPWGSVSTIIAHSYALQEKHLPRSTGGMLLSAILSDTLNLRSPTTTEWDKRMVTMLVQYVGLKDVNMFAAAQFRAKSHELSLMSPYALVHGDMKLFKFEGSNGNVYTVGYSVIETTDAQSSLERASEIIVEMKDARHEQESLTAILLAIVDIVKLESELLICGPVEESLALDAYGGTLREDGTLLNLPGLVSRKNDFIPPLARAFKDGWVPPRPSLPRRRSSTVVMSYKNFSLGPTRVYIENDDGDNNTPKSIHSESIVDVNHTEERYKTAHSE